MADIVKLLELSSGIATGLDITANTGVWLSIKVGGGVSNTELTKTILDRLVSLQDGTDVAAAYHTHDSRYFTETELGSAVGTSGAQLIGVKATPVNYTPGSADVEAHLAGIDSALASAGGNDFLDSVFRISDNADPTKKIAFESSGISTSTVRTITMPDANVDLGKIASALQKDGSVTVTADLPMGGFKLTGMAAGSAAGHSVRYEQSILVSGANAFTAAQSMGGFNLTSVADPTAPQHAATKAYVDAVAQGLRPKQAVRVASLADIALASALENGDTVDGITLVTGDRVLVKNQTLPEENGIYIVQASGAAVRAPDMDSLTPIDEINGAYTFIQSGTQAGQGWVEQSNVAVLDTDPMVWVYFNSAAAIIGGDMVTVTGQTISLDLATASGLESSNPSNSAGQLRIKLEASNPSLKFSGSNELGLKMDAAGALASGASGAAVQVDGSTIEISSNALRVKDAGITLAKMASNSVDENKIAASAFNAAGAITGGGASKLAVQVDGSTLEISANALRQKDAGTTAAKLNTDVADQTTIAGGAGTALNVLAAPLVSRTLVAGEAFAADVSFSVRWALTGETAGRVYKADKDASASAKYMGIGIGRSVAGVSAGGNIQVIMLGTSALGANDSAFAAGDVGKELYVGTTGAFILGSALADTTNEAAFCIGTIQSTSSIWVDFKQLRGIN